MDEHALGGLIDEVRAGRLSRRRFVAIMASLGLTAPVPAHLLASAGLAQTRPQAPSPSRRGAGGSLLVRNEATAVSRRLQGVEITPWGSNLWNLASWSREA